MKEIEFSEDQLHDIGSIAQALFGDETDPRSYAYNRVLVRPKIRWLKIACFALIPTALLWLLGWFIGTQTHSPLLATLIPLGIFLLYLVFIAKRSAICLIRIYQRYAPKSMREKCRFEPSCSEYMILSIQKYGLWKGLAKGTNRLKRCNVDNGGYDYP